VPRFAPRAFAEIALMAALTAAGAFVKIPLPYVPVTLQVVFVCLAGVWLGPLRGALSQVVYLITGLLGFPVFARGGGLHYVLEPSFGYLLGFVPAAFVVGQLTRRSASFRRCLLAIYAGLALVYLPGIAGLYLNLNYVVGRDISLEGAAKLGLAPLPKDLVLGLFSAYAARQVKLRLPPALSLRRDSCT